MARQVKSARPSLNPLKCGGTILPPHLLLMAKLIALSMLLTGLWYRLPDPFLPFLSIFDHLGPPAVFHWMLEGMFLFSAAFLLFNRHVRTSCLLLGSTVLVSILSSRPFYSNNKVLCGCVLLLTGLYEPGWEPWLIRSQIALVYFGAGLNKLFDLDWRSGQFFEYWGTRSVHHALYAQIASYFPSLLISKMVSWATIVTEFGLSVGFLIYRLFPWAIWGGLAFHTALLLLTGRTFGRFYYALLASYLAFVEWPPAPLTVHYDGDCAFTVRMRHWTERLDLEGSFHWVPFQLAQNQREVSENALRDNLRLVAGGKVHKGFAAFRMMLLYNPLTYFVLVALVAGTFALRKWVAVMFLVLFSPLFIPIGEALLSAVAQRRSFSPAVERAPFPQRGRGPWV